MTAFDAELPEALAGERLDRVVAMLCDVPRSVAGDLIDAGAVRVDGVVRTRKRRPARGGPAAHPRGAGRGRPRSSSRPTPTCPSRRARGRRTSWSSTSPPASSSTPVPATPPARWCTACSPGTPRSPTVGEPFRPGIVHRLDRETSGLLVVARTGRGPRRPRPSCSGSTTSCAATGPWCGTTSPSRAARSTPPSGGPPRTRPRWPSRSGAGGPHRLRGRAPLRRAGPGHRAASATSRPAAPTRSACTSAASATPWSATPATAAPARRCRRPASSSTPSTSAFRHPVTGEPVVADSPLPADLQAVLDRLA